MRVQTLMQRCVNRWVLTLISSMGSKLKLDSALAPKFMRRHVVSLTLYRALLLISRGINTMDKSALDVYYEPKEKAVPVG